MGVVRAEGVLGTGVSLPQKANCHVPQATWSERPVAMCEHDGALVSRDVRHHVVCATCGVASVMVMRGSGRLSKIEYLFFIFVKL